MAGTGVVGGVRTAIAQVTYFGSKYGAAKDDEQQVLKNCERAFMLYPHNYRFCTWTAEMAWYGRHGEDGIQNAQKRAFAEHWCRHGLSQNPFDRQLWMLEVNLLMDTELKTAIEKLEEHIEWDFWEPYHHAVLAELYSRDGRYGDAIDSLAWVKGSEYERDARQRVREAWKAELEAATTSP